MGRVKGERGEREREMVGKGGIGSLLKRGECYGSILPAACLFFFSACVFLFVLGVCSFIAVWGQSFAHLTL